MDIGTFLFDRRTRAGLTQVDLAARSGLSQSMVSAVEAGRRQPSLPLVERMLAGLDLRLKLDTEPLGTDADLLEARLSPDQTLDRPGFGFSALLSKLAPLESAAWARPAGSAAPALSPAGRVGQVTGCGWGPGRRGARAAA